MKNKHRLYKLFSHIIKSTTDNELPRERFLDLIVEQALIERMACLQEIQALRMQLQLNNVDSEKIPDWTHRSDKILDKLLRYKLGEHGKLVKNGILIMPYSWRRKFRNLLKPINQKHS